MRDQNDFNKAMGELPNYIGGYDPFVHKTPNDLAWVVSLQVDLFDEGEDSEVRTAAMRKRCVRYIRRWGEGYLRKEFGS